MAREKGVSNLLNAYPLKEYGFDLSKQQFWDGISIRYVWPFSNLPTTCACSSMYAFQQSMSCNKRGLVSIGHNKIRDLTANMLRDVSNDAEVEVKLMPLTGEQLQYRSVITGVEARLDIRARSFWVRGQEAFLDIRVFNPNANGYLNAALPRCHEINEKEKKRNYNNRILQIEHGTFTPLVFSIYGSMGRECTKFYSKLEELLSDKRKKSKLLKVDWLRTKVCFGLLKSCLLCLRGSRSVNRNIVKINDNFVNVNLCFYLDTLNAVL